LGGVVWDDAGGGDRESAIGEEGGESWAAEVFANAGVASVADGKDGGAHLKQFYRLQVSGVREQC